MYLDGNDESKMKKLKLALIVIAVKKDIGEEKSNQRFLDGWTVSNGHSQPQLGHRGTCAVEIDNAVDGGIDTKPDKVPNGDNIGEGLPQLVTGLLLNEEVAGVEDDLEGGAAGLLLPPVAQDSSRQTVVLVHNPGEGVGDQESDEDVLLNT